MDDFSTVEQLLTIRLIQEDAEAIYSLLKSEKDPIFSLCVIPYYALFVQSCEEYMKTNAFEKSTAKRIKDIRNNIKAYADRVGKTTRRIAAVDKKQDSLFRDQLQFGFMKQWNIHYNLGTYWVQDKKIVGNTQMLNDVLGIDDIFDRNIGGIEMELARQISSYVASVRSGLAENFSPPEIYRKNHEIEIPFYCDFNTNTKNKMIKYDIPKEINILFLHLLCSLNFVKHVLSGLFYPGNTWIFRIQYITTYYAFYALGKLNNHLYNNPDSGIDVSSIEILLDEGKALFLTDFRNCMMHYDLQKHSVLTPENLDKPLFGLVENCFPNHSYESYSIQLETYRNKLCEYIEQYFDFSGVALKENE